MLKFLEPNNPVAPGVPAKIPTRLRDFNRDGRSGAALLAVCGGVLALQLPGAAAVHRLEYDRAAIAAGEWWRLLTAHLIHLDFRHAALDLAGLALLWVLFARDLAPRAWTVVILITVAAIDGGLWVRDPGVSWYLGLSGMLHGLLAAALLVRVRRGDLEAWLLVGLLLAKLGYEQIHGAMPFAGDMPVVVDAHLYGALGGFAAAILVDSFGVAAPSVCAPGEERAVAVNGSGPAAKGALARRARRRPGERPARRSG